MKPIICVIGWSDTGKTLLVSRIIRFFYSKGFRVGAVKSTHQQVDLDPQGKDSRIFRENGAGEVLLASRNIHYLFSEPKPLNRDYLTSLFPDSDLIVTEGASIDGAVHIETAGRAESVKELKTAIEKIDILITGSSQLRKTAEKKGITVFGPEEDNFFGYLEEILWKER